MMNDCFASLRELVALYKQIYPASSGRRRATGARHSHPSSNAASCADDNAIRPVVCVDGQANWPCSSRLLSMHSPTPSQPGASSAKGEHSAVKPISSQALLH
jgi:hypothetical protein